MESAYKRTSFPSTQFKTYVKFRRPNKVWIYLNLDEATDFAESLATITRAHIPSPERWRLLADISHDLDMALEGIKKEGPNGYH